MIRMPLLWKDGWLASWLAFDQSVVSCPFAVLIIAAFFCGKIIAAFTA
jgi:hypothetical protein